MNGEISFEIIASLRGRQYIEQRRLEEKTEAH
jgi:hypothetical protein